MSCSVGCTHGSDPELLWLWHRPEATALIGPLAWEPPYATSAALKRHVLCRFAARPEVGPSLALG